MKQIMLVMAAFHFAFPMSASCNSACFESSPPMSAGLFLSDDKGKSDDLPADPYSCENNCGGCL